MNNALLMDEVFIIVILLSYAASTFISNNE